MSNPAGPPMQQDALPITNTLFPPPPDYYKAFTDANLERYGEGSRTNKGRADGAAPESEVEGEPLDGEALKLALDKPRVDWIREEGRWGCFGQPYYLETRLPRAEDLGLQPLIDPSEPPTTSLPPLLHSFLHTLLLLLDSLTNTALTPDELMERRWPHEGEQYIQHLTNLAANLMVSANQLRDVQAEATLVLLMEKQLATRREQTAALKRKCQTIAANLEALRTAAATAP